jgi:hypothetical protein
MTHDATTAGTPAPETIDRDSARAFCAGLAETVDALIRVLDEETRLIRAARLSEAAGLADEKTALAQRYGQAHGTMKVCGPEIGRKAPVEIDHLRRRHEALETAIANNLAVLATARTVSETLIRGVAEAVSSSSARPNTYSAEARQDTDTRSSGPFSLNVAL